MKTNRALRSICSSFLAPCALVIVGTVGLNGKAAQALTFNFNSAPGIDPQALSGFQKAANIWSSLFTDDVTINMNIGYEQLETGVIAQAGSETEVFDYLQIRDALNLDKTSADDATAVANLPGIDIGSGLEIFAFVGTEEDGSLELDPTDSITADNFFLDVNRANAKALGLIAGNDSGLDASLTFSSAFNFDFDPSDGIGAGLLDFVGVATHEIGHALGFVSGVDIVDITSLPDGPFAPFDLDNFAVFNVLDLYRYSDLSVALSQQFGVPILDLAVGGNPYFSIDRGATNLGSFSTGAFNGDGRQASHWEDDNLTGQYLGIMDPTYSSPVLNPSQPRFVTRRDVQAFDVIGWDVASVPEPRTLVGLMAIGTGLLLKRKKSTVA